VPLYDYRCETCDLTQEVIHRMAETPTLTCPRGHPMVRMLSAPAVHFKGYFPGKRSKEVDARKRRLEQRVEEKLKKGEMTKQDVRRMRAIRDKYARSSPYLDDPAKIKSQTAPADPTQGFDDGVDHNVR
jgi:putative FmdB family regulatory protein